MKNKLVMAGVFLLALGMGGCVIREQQSASKTAETEALLDKLIRLPKKDSCLVIRMIRYMVSGGMEREP